ncbi:superoxide dismutase [Candidatus Sumerlaeota bacterium]|nr:superoxide dismutase [Candidatus Sumerlaeota bacterium]
MAHQLPALPYAYDALEPHIDARTVEIHHDKHHNAYVTNLNAALEGHPELQDKPLTELLSDLSAVPESIRMAVRNNGGGVWNHNLYWQCMSGDGGGEPTGELAGAIKRDLGGFAAFKEQFTKAGATRFGSGWAWLCVGGAGKLCVCSTPNQDIPIMKGVADCPGTPILTMDVWEHSYYLKYQNRRPDYIAAFFNVINWSQVADHYAAAK